MKAAEKKRIAKAIQSVIPELYHKGGLLAFTPRGRILRGFYLENSSDTNRVYIWKFVQPLYLPCTDIVFSLGDRLVHGSQTWTVEDADDAALAARDEGLSFCGPISSPEALADWSYVIDRPGYACEARAVSLIAAGRDREGTQALRRIAASINDGDDHRQWVLDIRDRAKLLADLAETAPEKAHALLEKWEAGTIAALRVEKIP